MLVLRAQMLGTRETTKMEKFQMAASSLFWVIWFGSVSVKHAFICCFGLCEHEILFVWWLKCLSCLFKIFIILV